MNKFFAFFKHLRRWREFYLVPLLMVVVCLCTLYWVRFISGRPAVDDPGIVVAFAYNGIGAAFVLLLTGLTQEVLFGFRSERPPEGTPVPFRDDVFDAACTAFLLVLWTTVIFSLL